MNANMLEKIKKLKNPKVWIPVSAIIVIVIAALTYWLATSEDDITYMTEKARVGNISQVVEATGEVAAVTLVNVGAQVSGQIKKLYVVLGQEVKQGDMIAEIDSQTQENTLNTDRAKLANYKAQLEARKILLNIAKKQYDRELVLIKTNSTSQQNLENARDTYATARANVNEMESLIKQTQITINTDETNLGYTKIRAPLNGTIVSVPVEDCPDCKPRRYGNRHPDFRRRHHQSQTRHACRLHDSVRTEHDFPCKTGFDRSGPDDTDRRQLQQEQHVQFVLIHIDSSRLLLRTFLREK